MPHDSTDSDLNHRERAILQAVAEGGAEITSSNDLFLNGLACCDQSTAHRLARDGLLAPAHPGEPGQRVPAVLTDAGKHALGVPMVGAS